MYGNDNTTNDSVTGLRPIYINFFSELIVWVNKTVALLSYYQSYYLGSQKPTGTVVSLDYSEDGTPVLDTSFSIWNFPHFKSQK